MFSKAKRFESIAPTKTKVKSQSKTENETNNAKQSIVAKNKLYSIPCSKINFDTQSQCSSSVKSVRSFATPKPFKNIPVKQTSSLKKPIATKHINNKSSKIQDDDLIKGHEVEIRNKDYTIHEYLKQIEDLKCEIAKLHKLLNMNSTLTNDGEITNINEKLSLIDINDFDEVNDNKENLTNSDVIIKNLTYQIQKLQEQCDKLEQEVSNKQVELNSLEDVITIRDSLCTDLQKKLTTVESCLEETHQRLEMVKGHHALALEANESIRREYKVELEALKSRLDDEKQTIINKGKSDLENLKNKYSTMVDNIRNQENNEKDEQIYELQNLLENKDKEMKAKIEQINEATREKLKLCEIQFEERTRELQADWSLQQSLIKDLESEITQLKTTIVEKEENLYVIQRKNREIQDAYSSLENEKSNLLKEIQELKEESKNKIISFENEVNRLTVDIDKIMKEKNKFEMSLTVTRDTVHALTLRLRKSDKEMESLENEVETLTSSKVALEAELATYKNSLNNSLMECNEYREALVNILKSKAALAKEHNRIMEHNVTLIESLQNVEKEAYRELGSIKSDLIEDVELLKKESNSQIQLLREEVEKKRVMCELAAEHAGQANAAAEQSRALLARAAADIAKMEAENRCLQQQIQDQQSLVVELSLLRQENEELTMNLAKQTSIIDKLKKEADQGVVNPKSPSLFRKSQKIGKENVQTVVSPLRERNH